MALNRLHCIFCIFAGALAAAPVSPLEAWKHEIEQASGAPITLVQVSIDPATQGMKIAGGIEYASIIRRYLTEVTFRRQLEAAHALTLNYDGPEGRHHFVLLNMNLAEQWKSGEEGLIAHELGHIWLHARGYTSPPFEPGERACLAIHSGDIPQHVLLREEMRRRGISARELSLATLRLALDALESGQAPRDLPPCRKLVLVSQWLDLRLGLTPGDWDGFDRFEKLNQSAYPDLAPHVSALEQLLRQVDLTDTAQFQRVVGKVRERLALVFDTRPSE